MFEKMKMQFRMTKKLGIKIRFEHIINYSIVLVSDINIEYSDLKEFDKRMTRIRIDVVKKLFDKMSDFLKLEAEEEILFWAMVLQKSEELEKDKIIPSHS